MARKRGFTTFSLSFLDIMSCGFGAVALIFLIIKHGSDVQMKTQNQDLLAEVNLLEEEIRIGEENLVRARNTLSALDQQFAEAQGLARRINDDIEAVRRKISELDDGENEEEVKALQAKLKALDEERKKLEEENEQQGNDIRQYVGEGNRQYLTGLRLGGTHNLILLDASASMLDDTLVNVIRRRNMSDNVKRASPKWRRAAATAEWLVAKLPQQSQYQIYTFNTGVKAAVADTKNLWLNVSNSAEVDAAVKGIGETIPAGGTSLERIFGAISGLDPLPDNLFLITDGLPTQGLKKPKRNTISSVERVKLFTRAVKEIPRGIPVNIILLPMEGDPMAAAAYWQLAQDTKGSFLSPSQDWP